jgi:hypothetical protein
MLDKKVIDKLKEKYPDFHPLFFHRSVERAKSNGHLFDILDTTPKHYPLRWNDKEGCWEEVDDLYLLDEFEQLG